MDFIFQLAVLILSIVIHEVSHGLAAKHYGDLTAEYQGRLTLNPLKHIDPVGSVLVPIIMKLSNTGIIFGWAKPVPYNPYNLKPGRWPEAAVALAGPASNLLIAIACSLLLRAWSFGDASILLLYIVAINLMLTVFNLVPIPPLDGSKLLFALFPEKVYRLRHFFERYGLLLVILFIFFAWPMVSPIVGILFHFLTGFLL